MKQHNIKISSQNVKMRPRPFTIFPFTCGGIFLVLFVNYSDYFSADFHMLVIGSTFRKFKFIQYTCPSNTDINITDRQMCHLGYFKNVHGRSKDITWFEGRGNYSLRLSSYNSKLAEIRKVVLMRLPTAWRPLKAPTRSTWSKESNPYLTNTSAEETVTTLALAWDNCSVSGNIWNSFEDNANVLVTHYYKWTGSQSLCDVLVNKTYEVPFYAWGTLFKKLCTSNLSDAIRPIPLEVSFLDATRPAVNFHWPKKPGTLFPDRFYYTLPNFVHYIQLVEDGYIDVIGDVYSSDIKLAQYSCSPVGPGPSVLVTSPPADFDIAPMYDEIFVVSQTYNHVRYHSSIEDAPRAFPYIKFLTEHPHIKIHTGPPQEPWISYFGIAKINKTRFVAGNVRTRIAYIPQSTDCGMNQVQATQLLRKYISDYLEKEYPDEPRKSIVIIKRLGYRRLKTHDTVEMEIKNVAAAHNLTLEVYAADKNQMEILRMFRRALFVIGPHGAGLLNLIACRPGTFVIEAVCSYDSMVLYYLWEAHTLGLRWHGVYPKDDGCDRINADPKEFIDTVKYYMPVAKEMAKY